MHFLEDPSEMTPDQRLTEIAMILASGVRRIRSPEIPPDSSDKGLDVSRPPTPPCDGELTDGDPEEGKHEAAHSGAS